MPAPLVKYAFFYPFDIFCFFVKNQVFEGLWIITWVFYSVPLVILSFYANTRLFSVLFAVRDCDASRSSFSVQDCFGCPGFFAFLNEVECHSFEVFEEFCWDFDGH